MKYVGSKNRISKEIAPILQKCIDENDIKIYFEPFVGGANMIDKIKCETRIGNDIHKELIALFQEIQKGWQPPLHITEEEYNKVKDNKSDYPDYYVALVGFCATFGSKWFGGYARGFKADKVTPRDIPNEAIRNLLEQIPNLQGIEWLNKPYNELEFENSLLYCDIPYKDVKQYNTSKDFNHDDFWNWVREMSKENFVFISEYNAPQDFKCIWQKKVTTSLKVKEHEERLEKLFIHS